MSSLRLPPIELVGAGEVGDVVGAADAEVAAVGRAAEGVELVTGREAGVAAAGDVDGGRRDPAGEGHGLADEVDAARAGSPKVMQRVKGPGLTPSSWTVASMVLKAFTMTCWSHETLLPHESVAVHVTVFVPAGNGSCRVRPPGREYETTTLQLSVAMGPTGPVDEVVPVDVIGRAGDWRRQRAKL